MKKLVLILFSLVLLPFHSPGQGFNSRNGRNHPELDWKVAETAHFKIMYPVHLAGIENMAAPVAEQTYAVLSKNLETRFNEKIRIYLSDEDEIANGFAVPIGNGYTDIWVNMNSYAETWTGEVKWLRKVISHELAHIFHFEATRSNMGNLRYVFADPTPSFWTEGLAQYETEKWDSQRGDRWLRLAVFDDQMSYSDGSSPLNGRLRYAVGNSQLRYFTQTYGDSSLASLLDRRKSFLGIFELHDFYNAFREETGTSYTTFYDEWRKHVNIYYNTLASKMGRSDSLDGQVKGLPGRFYYDLALDPGGKQMAVLAMTSMERPVRRIYLVKNDSSRRARILTEGSVNADIDWHPGGNSIVYSRTARGSHGSLVPDIHILDIDTGDEKRLTYDKRATHPVFDATGDRLAYIVNNGGTANIYMHELQTGNTADVTHYTGDVQLIDLAWNHQRNELVFHRFDGEGNRHLVLLNLDNENEKILDDGGIDNRMPVIGPLGEKMAYTSLRDEVPNVFIYDFEEDSTWRVTNLFTGGEAHGWSKPDQDNTHGDLYIFGGESKSRDYFYTHGAGAVSEGPVLAGDDIEKYSGWRAKTPPNTVPYKIESNAGQIQGRYDYNALQNMTHVQTLALPYYENSQNFGLMGLTAWTEPLGKHTLAAGGYLSFKDTGRDSYGMISYVNNTLYPTISFSTYRVPGSARWYQDRFLVEHLTGAEVAALVPLDGLYGTYQSSSVGARLRHQLIRPTNREVFDNTVLAPAPQKGRQTDLQVSWIYKKQRPWHDNLIHPIDGQGLKISLTGAAKILSSETSFLSPDIQAFKLLPGAGLHRIYLYGRMQAQFGSPLPQNYIGFSRYDNIELPFPDDILFLFEEEAERVRGYRSFVAGDRVAFGTVEYRMPFLSSLNTRLLGLLSLGKTTLSLVADGGVVWNARTPGGKKTVKRLGLGSELKNEVRLGPIRFVHSLGIAQPYDRLLGKSFYDLYYRVQATVPF